MNNELPLERQDSQHELAEKDGIDYIPNYQKSEVSDLQWMDLDFAIKKIRPYNIEKIDILKKIDNILKSYNIYL